MHKHTPNGGGKGRDLRDGFLYPASCDQFTNFIPTGSIDTDWIVCRLTGLYACADIHHSDSRTLPSMGSRDFENRLNWIDEGIFLLSGRHCSSYHHHSFTSHRGMYLGLVRIQLIIFLGTRSHAHPIILLFFLKQFSVIFSVSRTRETGSY